jgi:hypothetical protein
MSYVTWHNYGFGICVDDVDTQDVARLETMLKLTPELEQKIHNWLKESSINEPTWADYMEFDQDFGLGLATILQDVIRESEGICLTACNNYDGKAYLLYQPDYPWNMLERERNLTEQDIVSLFQRYVGMLTDKPVNVDYQEVENGG